MMKTDRIRYGCALLGLSLLLSGCGKDVPPPSESTPAASVQTVDPSTPKPEKVYDDSLLETAVSETGVMTDEFGQNWSYDYQLPRLLDDTKAAMSINQAIMDTEGAAVSECMDAITADNTPPFIGTISWESHWNGSLLSLVISRTYSYHSETDYQVFLYDFETGESLTTAQLLARQGLTEDQFFRALRRSAAAELDEENQYLYDQFGDCFAAAADLRAQTISSINLAPDRVPVFLNDEGQLTAVINKAVYAGGGVVRTTIVPDLTPPESVTKSAQCAYVAAELKDGQVLLTFRQTEESDWYVSTEGLSYDTPYPVEGLYGSYTDMVIGIMGQDLSPYLFLIDSEGRVTYCDILLGCQASAPRFFAAGPLPGIEHAVSFEAESCPDGQIMYVHTADGQRLSLFEYTAAAKSALNTLIAPESSWQDEQNSFVLHITEDAVTSVRWNNGANQLAEGTLYYAGMTEEGLQYPFSMWDQNYEHVSGVLTLECFTPYSGAEGDNRLILHQHTGPLLPGVPEDGCLVLTRQWSY